MDTIGLGALLGEDIRRESSRAIRSPSMSLREQLQESVGGSYTVERELGGGGMSRVFLADERRLNRKVVIKVLSPELAAGVSAERFELEIQLAASLQQANIVPILAAGDMHGVPFYTMPYVEGESLRACLRRQGRLHVSTAANILRDVAKALVYAHERGVVHRDIKPDNVLLSGGTAVVTDFGIAKALSAARGADGDGALTQFGTSMGTPAYMSPEQAASDPSLDHRTDVYSFGCMAFELLAGSTPFHDLPPARLLAAHISEPPPPLDVRRPDAPAEFERLIMRCLRKNPDERPQSAVEIVQALDSILSGATGSLTSFLTRRTFSLPRALGFYAVLFVVVAMLARAAIIALNVPDWVERGAIMVTALGLPAILSTWYVQRRLREPADTTPTATPRSRGPVASAVSVLAPRMVQWFTWQRTWVGGVLVLSGYAVAIGAFVLMRALGVGPVGSLFATGALANRDRLIVTSFSSSDTSLAMLINEAVRANLSQSRVVSVVSPVAIAAALERMQRPRQSELTFDLARQVAQREGVKAIVDGSVRSVGSRYALTIRLVSVDSAEYLAVFQKTADGLEEVLRAVDEVARRLRGKIGESLREVRESKPLEQVTTPSLEALRIYARAARLLDTGGDPLEGAARLREAIGIDTTFAMAYRKLGVALSNAGMPRIQVDSALEMAYRHRDRLTERERLMAEGTYFYLGPGRDRREAMAAYEAALAIDPGETIAANNLAIILNDRREFARAESLFRRRIAAGNPPSSQYTNLVILLFNTGRLDEAARVVAEQARVFPGSLTPLVAQPRFMYERGQLDAMERSLHEMASNPSVSLRANGLQSLALYAVLRGRLEEAARTENQLRRVLRQLGQRENPVGDSLRASWIDLLFRDDTARAVRRAEWLLASPALLRLAPEERPWRSLVAFFGRSARPGRAAAILAQFDAKVDDPIQRLRWQPERHNMLGDIAAAQGRPMDAVRHYWKADTTYDGPNGACRICQFDDLGWAWSLAGNADSALFYWERFLSTPYYARLSEDAYQKGPMLYRMAELFEARGDIVNAARVYREFIALWAHADPAVQAKVAAARDRLSRLTDIERR